VAPEARIILGFQFQARLPFRDEPSADDHATRPMMRTEKPSALRRLTRTGRSLAGSVYSRLPSPGASRPIFIIGCGRSGTTILGTALSKHAAVTYLNEPRHLWYSAYPITDIWTSRAAARQGKLFLSESDADPNRSVKLKRLFHFETIVSGRPVLIEKLPINAFRLRFISRIFPDARFVHIYRSGLEVARSIELLSTRGSGNWWGVGSYKWNQLAEYAACREDTRGLPALCTDEFDKGLLEWRLSTEAVVAHLRALPDDAYCELGYDELVDNPVETVSRVLAFIGLDGGSAVRHFASAAISRRTDRLPPSDISEKSRLIGGALLRLSLNGQTRLTTHRT
jgi:hypothetical protein